MSRTRKENKNQEDVVKTESPAPVPTVNAEAEDTVTVEKVDKIDMLLKGMSTIINQVETISSRVSKLEGKPSTDYKLDAKQADIDAAAKMKENVDPKVVSIVEEILGVDFGVELTPHGDRPGFLFSIIVPQRLSELKPSMRPIINELTGEYEIDSKTKEPKSETYFPVDRRSRNIGSAQSYDAIREHAERVRAYIVGYYQRNKKPVPEFKLKG